MVATFQRILASSKRTYRDLEVCQEYFASRKSASKSRRPSARHTCLW